MIKINFFGTHNFAAQILQALVDSADFNIAAVFTAPDKPVGRHQEIQKSAVKILAEKYHLKIVQPATLKNFDFTPFTAQVNIVCQYGFKIPKNILEAPAHQSINVHTSLLPKYRGASPIQSAILNGDKETGVTIMLMDEELDHGAILAQKTVPISPTDIHTDLEEKLLLEAKSLLTDTVRKWVLGPKMAPQAQDEAKVTVCRELKRNDGKIDFSWSAEKIYNLYRGLTPWPGVWANFKDKRVKFLVLQLNNSQLSGAPGETDWQNGQLLVYGAKGALQIEKLQIEGGKPQTGLEFWNGQRKQAVKFN